MANDHPRAMDTRLPELPEVEVISRAVAKAAVGRTVQELTIARTDLRIPVPAKALKQGLVGRKVTAVYRKAKYLVLQTDDYAAVLHFGMSGNMFLEKSPKPVWPHTHAVFTLAGGANDDDPRFLHFADPRRFGLLTGCPLAELPALPQFATLGPDPLEHPGPRHQGLSRWLAAKAKGKKQPVKTFIMTNQVVVGVGNIYANESLFRAGIHPLAPAGEVSPEGWRALARQIKAVLLAAIEKGGSSIKDFKTADGNAGYFSMDFKVYGKGGEPCPTCGLPIESSRLQNRATYFCSPCQS